MGKHSLPSLPWPHPPAGISLSKNESSSGGAKPLAEPSFAGSGARPRRLAEAGSPHRPALAHATYDTNTTVIELALAMMPMGRMAGFVVLRPFRQGAKMTA